MCCCKDCKDRNIYCHTTCTKYKEYLDNINKIKEEKQKRRDISNYSRDEHYKALKHQRKKYRHN